MLYATNLRRCAALIYDGIIIFSILLIGTAMLLLCTGGRAIPSNNPYYQGFLGGLIAVYFVGFWIFGGQTTGMKAWGLRLTNSRGLPISTNQAITRFLIAIPSILCFGIGFVWCFFDNKGRAWYDHLTGTKLLLINGGKQ